MATYRKKTSSYRRKPLLSRRKPKKTTLVSKNIKKYVKSVMPKPEVKVEYKSEDETQLAYSSNYLAASLLKPVQGTSSEQRVGQEIKAIGIHFRGILNNTSVAVPVFARQMFVDMYEDPVATTTEFWAGQTSAMPLALSAVTGLTAIYQPVNKKRVKVLFDKVYKIGANGSSGDTSARAINTFCKLNHVIKFDENDVGNLNQNHNIYHILFIARGDDDIVSTEVMEVSYVLRSFFIDP